MQYKHVRQEEEAYRRRLQQQQQQSTLNHPAARPRRRSRAFQVTSGGQWTSVASGRQRSTHQQYTSTEHAPTAYRELARSVDREHPIVRPPANQRLLVAAHPTSRPSAATPEPLIVNKDAEFARHLAAEEQARAARTRSRSQSRDARGRSQSRGQSTSHPNRGVDRLLVPNNARTNQAVMYFCHLKMVDDDRKCQRKWRPRVTRRKKM